MYRAAAGDGNLLDHAALYWGSGMSNGNQRRRVPARRAAPSPPPLLPPCRSAHPIGRMHSLHCRRLAVPLLLLMVLWGRPVGAQSARGTVVLSALLPDGSPALGTRIELVSDGHPGASYAVVLDDQTAIGSATLQAGGYRLTADLAGFQVAVVAIEVRSGTTVRVVTSLMPSGEPAATHVVVEYEATDAHQISFAGDELERLPGSRTVWSILEIAHPLVVADRIDNGGLASALPVGFVGSCCAGGFQNTIDPNLRRPQTDEFMLAFAHALGASRRQITGIDRRERRQIGSSNIGVTPEDYRVTFVNDPGVDIAGRSGVSELPIYDRHPSSVLPGPVPADQQPRAGRPLSKRRNHAGSIRRVALVVSLRGTRPVGASGRRQPRVPGLGERAGADW